MIWDRLVTGHTGHCVSQNTRVARVTGCDHLNATGHRVVTKLVTRALGDQFARALSAIALVLVDYRFRSHQYTRAQVYYSQGFKKP